MRYPVSQYVSNDCSLSTLIPQTLYELGPLTQLNSIEQTIDKPLHETLDPCVWF